VLGALSVLVLPLLLSLLNGLRVRNCNLEAGFAFFALLPVATALYAAPAGFLAGLASERRGRLVAWLIPVASVLWSLARLYLDPPVFVFDPFGGYFPGPIYDEALRPPERLLDFRLANLLWIATAIAVAAALRRLRQPGRARVAAGGLALVLLIASLAVFGQRGPLGFHVDRAQLVRVLKRETRSTHFVVHSDPAADGTPEERELVLRDLEFRFDSAVPHAGRPAAAAHHRVPVPERGREEDPGGRGRHPVRQALDPGGVRAGGALSRPPPAPRAGPRLRQRLRGSHVRGVAGLALAPAPPGPAA
jgi:hypothetical protein